MTNNYGIRWGPVAVTRLAVTEGRGLVLAISTPTVEVEVWVSEQGRNVSVNPRYGSVVWYEPDTDREWWRRPPKREERRWYVEGHDEP